MLLIKLRHAAFSTGDEVDVQEWLNIYSNKPGCTALTEEEIVPAVNRPDKVDDKLITG